MKTYNSIPLIMLTTALTLPGAASAQTDELNGIWLVHSEGERDYPTSEWSPEELPFTAEGEEAFAANIPVGGEERRLAALSNDPLGGANPAGLYRSLLYNRPWEFVQLPDRVLQVFEYGNHWRTIWTDGREVPDEIVTGPYWYGYSVGRWEGDTFIVQTIDLDGRAWMAPDGTPLSRYGAKVEERWTRASNNSLELSITVNDPGLYSRPWSSDVKTYALQPRDSESGELKELIFAPIDEIEFNTRVRDPSATGPNQVD